MKVTVPRLRTTRVRPSGRQSRATAISIGAGFIQVSLFDFCNLFLHTRSMSNEKLGGTFTFPGTASTVRRVGYGAMQLAGPGVFGPPKDPQAAVAVLREAVAAGVNHVDTSDYYGPYVTNRIIREALHPYPSDLVLVTKIGAIRPADGSWQPAISPQDLTDAVHSNLRNLGVDALDIVNYRVMGSGHGTSEGSIAEPVTVLAELQRKGLIRNMGISNATA